MPVDFLTEEQRHQYGRYLGEPTAHQLARYFYLDDTDRAHITTCRGGDHVRLGFAVQLCTVRFLGTFLEDPTAVPPGVVVVLARQLAIADPACLQHYQHSSVRWHHTQRISRIFGYTAFADQPGHFHLVRWLLARAWWGNERPSVLFDRATDWLIERKILLPGVTVLERLVAQVRDRANRRAWRKLAGCVTPAHHARLEALLTVPPGARVTALERLRRAPSRQSGNGLLTALRRITEIRALEVGGLNRSSVPFNRIMQLFRFAQVSKAQALERMPTDRRIATLVAFAQVIEPMAYDDALDVLDWFLTDIFAQARRAGTQARLRTLKDLDAAALHLAAAGRVLLDPACPDHAIRSVIRATIPDEALRTAVAQIEALTRPPDETYYTELVAQTHRVGRVRPTLLSTVQFEALPAGQPVQAAYQFLQTIEPKSRPSMRQAPLEVVNRTWKRYVIGADHQIDRTAYTYCVLDRLREGLRRRDLFVTPSFRYADPRTGLLDGAAWETARPQVCRVLGRSTCATDELTHLSQTLDTAYRTTAARLPATTTIRTDAEGKPTLSLTPLDKWEEPPGLVALRATTRSMLPLVDLSQVVLEIHQRTGFAHEFTHVTEAQARGAMLDISICAVLLAQACNIGLTPVSHPNHPALTHERLEWVAQNYLRAETIARANARLVEAQNAIPLVHGWGGGEVASADGLRFVVPIRTIHAGANSRSFNRERGVTYYNLTSDQYTGLHGIVVTGTLRDSLTLISVLLGQQTSLHPHEIMTDTGAYADYLFGLLWLLGYQFSPRIRDAGGTRFWRIDRDADYGVLNDLAASPINLPLIEAHWDDLLRLAGSLLLNTVHIESVLRSLQRGDRPTRLGRALAELGRIIKTRFLLAYINDESYRRRILTQLNRGEGRHSVARAVFHGQRGELRQRYREGQEDQLGALGLVVNMIVLWNTLYLDQALATLRADGQPIADEDVARLSPLGYEHINMLGRYDFLGDLTIANGKMRPLRTPAA